LGYVSHAEGVTAEFIGAGNFTIEIAGERHAARAMLGAPYDPKGARVRS
jgi:4-methylaminobutanoate oxidase (formaldehyde-forming)